MRSSTHLTRVLFVLLAAVVALTVPAVATADPALPGEIGHDNGTHDHAPLEEPFSGPASVGMSRLAGSPKAGTTNSDLAFWQDLAIAGNYDGFRIFDISRADRPQELVDFACRGPQNDVSVYKIKSRLYLFQSVDRAQTKEDCTSRDTPLVSAGGTTYASPGFEGVRMFDITDPREPRFLTAFATDCGSHTHTLVPDTARQRLFLYVSSYPLGSGRTPPGSDGYKGTQCRTPHKKISIIEIPFSKPTAGTVREKALSSDTTPNRGFQGCHDVQAVLRDNIAIGSCAGDVQVWDISNRANPTSADGERHTHVPNRGDGRPFDFVHTAIATYDGRYMAVTDETGGGGTAECDGRSSDDGFLYFYRVPRPGDRTPALEGRYMIPRPQGREICVTHNGQMIPVTDGRYLASFAYYQGGTSMVDFTDPRNPREVAYTDGPDADFWSSYWYNDHVFTNGGLNRRAAGNPGFEVYSVTDEDGSPLRTRTWHHLNPQTQEGFQETGR